MEDTSPRSPVDLGGGEKSPSPRWWQKLFATGPQLGGWTIFATAIFGILATGAYCAIDIRVASQLEGVEDRLEEQINVVERRLDGRIGGVERRLGDQISDVDKHVGRVEGILDSLERLVMALQERIVLSDEDDDNASSDNAQ